MSQVEPMTAAEYRQWCNVGLGVNTERVLAALEERERLLGRVAVLTDERDRARQEAAEVRRLCEADASLGALVRRIREHPMVQRAGSAALLLTAHGNDGRDYWQPHFDGLTACLAHLDSLLPKEPEVVTGPSGKAYRVKDGVVEHLAIYPVNRNPASYSPPSAWERLEVVTLSDAPVVAKLMENSTHD